MYMAFYFFSEFSSPCLNGSQPGLFSVIVFVVRGYLECCVLHGMLRNAWSVLIDGIDVFAP
jgi:hypothetical protein